MFHWLIVNKEWLFSGVGVAVVVAIVTWLSSRRRKPGIGASPGTTVAAMAPERPDALATLSAEEVCAAADDPTLTTFQRSVRHDKYSGQRVRWAGSVQDVVGDKSSREITLWFHPFANDGSNAGYVCADFDRKVADALLVVKKGDVVKLEGTIRMPRTFGSVSLQNPVLLDHTAARIDQKAASNKSSVPSRNPPVDPSIGVAEVFGVLGDRGRTVLNVQADARRFEGRRVRWDGLVIGVSQVTKGIYELLFRATVNNGKTSEVLAELESVDEALLRAMSPGDEVDVVGTISLVGRSCRLLQAEILGHSKATARAASTATDRPALNAPELPSPDVAKK